MSEPKSFATKIFEDEEEDLPFLLSSPAWHEQKSDWLLTAASLPNAAASTSSFTAEGQELAEMVDGLGQLNNDILSVRGLFTRAKAVAEDIDNILGFFEDVENTARCVREIIDGVGKAMTLFAKHPVLKTIARRLNDVFDDIEDQIKKIEDKAAEIDHRLEPASAKVADAIGDLDELIGKLSKTSKGVTDLSDATQAADDNFIVIQYLSAKLAELLDTGAAGANEALDVLNAAGDATLPGLLELEATVADMFGIVDGISEISGLVDEARSVQADMQEIKSYLEVLQQPTEILRKVMLPLEPILSAADFVYNTVVAPVVDPVIDALGVEKLFDTIRAELEKLLPSGFDLTLTDLDTRIADLLSGLDQPDWLEAPEFLDSFDAKVTETLFEVRNMTGDGQDDGDESSDPNLIIFMEKGDGTGEGMNSADLIAGTTESETLIGNGGDDIFIANRGDDTIYGDYRDALAPGDVDFSGEDKAIFTGSFAQYDISRPENDPEGRVVVVDHLSPITPSGDEGTNTLYDVEKFSFADLENPIGIDELDQIVRLPGSQGQTFTGDGERNFVFGSSGNDYFDGLGGDDYLYGGAGTDTLLGGTGNDVLNAGAKGAVGLEFLDGGEGNDAADFLDFGSTARLLLDLSQDGPSVHMFYTTNVIVRSIEKVGGSLYSDIFYGDERANSLDGRAGFDTLRGLEGHDTLKGGDGNDVLLGDLGNDLILGGDGADLITTGGGSDTVAGGLGLDQIFYGDYSPSFMDRFNALGLRLRDDIRYGTAPDVEGVISRIEADLHEGFVRKYGVDGSVIGTDTISDIQGIAGTGGDDTIRGSDIDDYLGGGAGNDTFVSRGASGVIDRYYGDAGDDTALITPLGIHYFYAHEGNDRTEVLGEPVPGALFTLYFEGGSGTDELDLSGFGRGVVSVFDPIPAFSWTGYGLGAAGEAETAILAKGLEVLRLTDFADEVNANVLRQFMTGNFAVYGGAGDDTIGGPSNQSGEQLLFGEEGNDFILVDGDRVQAFGGVGDDAFVVEQREVGGISHTVSGGAGNDTVQVLSRTGVLDGGDGIDVLWYAVGDLRNQIRVSVDLAASSSNFQLAGGSISNFEVVVGGLLQDTLAGDEGANELAGRDHHDVLYGRGGNDTLWGGLYNDKLYGGDGNDLLIGGAGQDTLDGGAGIDTISYTWREAYFSIPGLFGQDSERANVSVDLAAGTAKTWQPATGLRYTDFISNVENVIGGDGFDTLRGDEGANLLIGGDGDDTIWGGAGDDILVGGNGQDRLYGEGGDDIIVYTLNEAEGTYTSAWIEVISGGSGEDTLDLTGDQDTLVWGEAVTGIRLDFEDPSASTSGSNMRVFGAHPSQPLDVAYVTPDFEVILGSIGNDTIRGTSIGERIEGSGHGDKTLGDADVLDGRGGADSLYGWGGDDTLMGGDGEDLIHGGLGDDLLTGGAGLDRFVWDTENLQGQSDSVTDLAESEFLVFAGGAKLLSLIGSADFNGDPGQVQVRATGGTTNLAIDLDGDGTADFDLVLTGEFSFELSEEGGDTVLTAGSASPPPQAVDDGFDYVTGTGAQVLDVLANDTPEALRIVSVGTENTRGMVTLRPDGQITYDAMGAFDIVSDAQSVTDSFTYVVEDAAGRRTTAQVTVFADHDADGIASFEDNAIFVANADQRDTDGDGYGNVVDADFNADGVVNGVDLGIFAADFGKTDPSFSLDTDLNGDGAVNGVDLGIMADFFGSVPGPSYIDLVE
ncbi:Ig-like domain-containing protein [Parvularcula maris]|uniref:Ig-like domain-containing protein n=1 Tax=Parvularcula maris TaxID=2965077 RepID=A0A9X2LBB6_9PROT|nr:Ig-like domain-containing protein [Parvularcula maris]MCQ8186343.1 Ig-like domain-containing protein [Parvularcula maris]